MLPPAEAANRLCPACGTAEPVRAAEMMWPPGWTCQACGHRIAERAGLAVLAPQFADGQSGFDPSFYACLEQAEPTHFWFIARNALLVGLTRRFFPAAGALLEIGCGNGAVLQALALSREWERLAGSDLHPEGLATARRRLPADVELVQMDATRIPALQAFDLIGAFDVLEHLADDEAAIREMARVLRPGGGVILAVPQHPWLWSRADDVARHQRRYRRGELEAKLARCGFRVVFSSSFVSLLLPLMVLNRLRPRRESDYAPAREFAIGARANRMLRAVLGVEIGLTLRGIRWPIGGSRVIVGKLVPPG